MSNEIKGSFPQTYSNPAAKALQDLVFQETKWGDHPYYLPIPFGQVIIRPLSSNHPSNPVKPGDSCFFYHGFVKDLFSYHKCPVYYGFKPWQEHPLGKMMSVVLKNEVNKYGTMEYENEGHPLLTHVLTNGDSQVYRTGWPGERTILMNVIDRGDNFCSENDQSKVLVTQEDRKGDAIYTSLGFPIPILSGMLKATKTISDTDFLIIRHNWNRPALESYTPFLEVYSSESNPLLFENLASESGPLTEEEKNYKLYDFHNIPLYEPSNAGYICRSLKNFIKEADKEFPSHHFEEYYNDLKSEEEKVNEEKEKEASKFISFPDDTTI